MTHHPLIPAPRRGRSTARYARLSRASSLRVSMLLCLRRLPFDLVPRGFPSVRAARRSNCVGIGAVASTLFLAACGSLPTEPAPVSDRAVSVEKPAPRAAANTKPGEGVVTKRGGGYYKDDGPGDNPPEDMGAIADAVPKVEPLHRFANRPYSVLGGDYTPLREVGQYKARGIASWYGKKFHGQKTSTGEIYDMYGMTAAHPILPLPSYVRVTTLASGKSIIVRVNDRGPFHADRIIDLSYTAAWKLGLIGGGTGMVEVESLTPGAVLPPTQLASKSEEPAPAKAVEQQPLSETEDATGAWLQLGAFGNRDNADALKSRLASQLGDISDKLVVRAAGNLFRVQLGPWVDAAEAHGVADKLADLLGMKPVLVRK